MTFYMALVSQVFIFSYFLTISFGSFFPSIPNNKVPTDPDAFRNVNFMLTNEQSQLITSKGYPVKEYSVLTSDGYVLGIQRIPHGFSHKAASSSPKPVVLLHHGILSASQDWVINFRHQSLGFILADAGYDVWLGNARGNTYSRKNINLSPYDVEFWKFTWDEIALIDVPATIDFILKTTGQKQLYYVGHSMGTTVIFALLSEKPEYNEKVRAIVALAPVTTVGYVSSALRYLQPFSTSIVTFVNVFGHGEFLPNCGVMKLLSLIFCKNNSLQPLCDNIIFLLFGFESAQQFNEVSLQTRQHVYTTHIPAGSSSYTLAHYGQMIGSKKFQKYDYGHSENLNKYGRLTPPEYALENITTPIALMWGLNDLVADPTDVSLLVPRLKTLKLNYMVPYPEWTHLDFIYGLDAKTVVYPKLLSFLKEY